MKFMWHLLNVYCKPPLPLPTTLIHYTPPPPCTLWPTYCKIHYTIAKILQLVQLEQWRPGCKSTVGSLMFLCINYWGLRKIHRFEDVNLWTMVLFKYYLHSISYFIAELWFKSWINSKKEIQKNKSQNRNEKCCNYRPCPWDLWIITDWQIPHSLHNSVNDITSFYAII